MFIIIQFLYLLLIYLYCEKVQVDHTINKRITKKLQKIKKRKQHDKDEKGGRHLVCTAFDVINPVTTWL